VSGRRVMIKGLSRAHLAIYRASGGRILGSLVVMPVLLLTTTGRRTGKQHATPLTFLRDGADLVMIASNGGADRPPDWWRNLQHDPHAVVQIRANKSTVTARTASPEERERLWPVITATYSGYAKYQQKTTRQIPVVLLTAD
jgi:deazaflavin-dependent oxidoreductase (nitroreductase family)